MINSGSRRIGTPDPDACRGGSPGPGPRQRGQCRQRRHPTGEVPGDDGRDVPDIGRATGQGRRTARRPSSRHPPTAAALVRAGARGRRSAGSRRNPRRTGRHGPPRPPGIGTGRGRSDTPAVRAPMSVRPGLPPPRMPRCPTSTFAGFTSRCSTPARCMASSPSAT